MQSLNHSFKPELAQRYLLLAYRLMCSALVVFISLHTYLQTDYLPTLGAVALAMILPGCFKTLLNHYSSFFMYYLFGVCVGTIMVTSLFTGGLFAPIIYWLVVASALSAFILPLRSAIALAVISFSWICFLGFSANSPMFQSSVLSREMQITANLTSLVTGVCFVLIVFVKFRHYLEVMRVRYAQLNKLQSNILSIFDETDDYIGMANAEGGVVYHNKSFGLISGYTNEEIAKKKIPDFHPKWALEKVKSEGIPSAAQKGSWTGETSILDAEKNEIPVLQTIIAHKNPAGEIEYLSTLMKDIRDIKDRERKLEEAKTLSERVAEIKAQFLANMSHEIRTPMNGILGMAELVSKEVDDPKINEMLATIKRSGDALLTILNDVLDHSKIEAGKLELESINFNIIQLIADVKEIMTSVAKERNLEIVTNVDESIPMWVAGDPTRLRQVITNLVSNAIKFSENGQIKIKAKAWNGANSEKTKIQIAVVDYGIGIPDDQQDKLFQPFSQIDVSTTRRFGGTGLGLVISKAIVEAFGGQISFESEVGKGTTFYVTGEFAIGSSPRVQGNKEAKKAEKIDILVVDDDAVNRKVIASLLRRAGHSPDFATNGQEALDRVSQEKYDLVLMDCHMPVMDGYEATRQIIATFGTDRPLIYALTASAMREDRDRCLAAGMDGFLSKPIRMESLDDLFIRIARKIAS